ncbi:DExH-box ATP-dependent RNA helicase DExH1 [Camellia lanceoleosa]|uniref:DExH-box ATP-dependent RNA helicase DExH1 n=1 Tax=Camellia lanceoleosa TaxID=1840588 RepID=A0ACC0I2S5_9ERIC|nr:DExH-box ATP-dependent RNA helicase DExH1 [Camellia lanceoleosa]
MLGDEIAKRGTNPGGKIAAAAKRNILKSLAVAYGQMILKSGFFHADPHPGNILICKGSEVALLDYGQVKDLPDNLRLGYANLVITIADKDPVRASESYRELGIHTLIHTLIKCEDGQKEMLKLAQTMFDTKLQPGVKMLQPFSEESSIEKIAVQAFPEELFSVLRMVESTIEHICRHEGDGAILVFLTGWDGISKLLEKIKANSLLRDPSKFLVLPLHRSMPTINQCEIFDRPHANVGYPFFLLRFYLLGMMVEFAKNVADFAAASGKKHIVVLSSLDFGRWQTIDMSRY